MHDPERRLTRIGSVDEGVRVKPRLVGKPVSGPFVALGAVEPQQIGAAERQLAMWFAW